MNDAIQDKPIQNHLTNKSPKAGIEREIWVLAAVGLALLIIPAIFFIGGLWLIGAPLWVAVVIYLVVTR